MNRSNGGNKTKFRLPIGAYVTYMLIAALMFTGAALSKYVVSTNTGDAARVASFNITKSDLVLESEDNILDSADADDKVEYSFYVNNTTEVAVRYEVDISGYGSSVNCAVDNETGEIGIGESQEVMITFTLANSEGAPKSVLDNIKVSVNVEQIN